MINGYFDTPFGIDGELVVIPDGVQVDGSVSYTQGWTVNYTLPSSNPSYKFMPWGQFNQLFYDITSATQYLQQNDAPAFITTTMNGGSPYSYPKYARVNLAGVNYISLQNSNTDTPPSSKWAISFGAVSGTFNIGHVAVFNDTVGTLVDGGPLVNYTLPKATTLALGGVIVDGTTIGVNGSGVISVIGLGTAAEKTASNNLLTEVASVNGSTVVGNIPVFDDTFGTIRDGGIAPGNIPPNTIYVTSSPYTYTPSAGMVKIKLRMWGGGGAGGGATGGNQAGGGGGGAGGYLEAILSAATIGSSKVITLGAGGTGGSTSGGTGGTGGTSSFGSICSCAGGVGGIGSASPGGGISGPPANGGAGGSATGGNINFAGNPGSCGDNFNNSNVPAAFGGNGGVSSLGGAGQGAFVTSGAATGGAGSPNSGSGGGGGANYASGSAAGGGGSSGGAIIEEYF